MPSASARQFLERLAKGKAPALVVLLGSDPYWLELCRKRLAEALVPEATREWAVTRLSADEADLEEVLGRAQTRPMLAPKQLVVVAGAEQWERGEEESQGKGRARTRGGAESEEDAERGSSAVGGSGNDARESTTKTKGKADDKVALDRRIEALNGYLKDPAPFTTLVLEVEKLDQRTRFARLLAEHGLIVSLDASGADPAQLAREMARGLGVEVELEAAARLADATAGRAARMAVELEKLACYVGERKKITASDVGELVVAEGTEEVWALADLFAAGKRAGALELVDELMRRGERAPALVGALAWMYRKLMIGAELPARTSQWEAAKALGMAPEAALAAIARAHRLGGEKLRDSLMALAEADDRLKSKSRDERATMAFLIARLTRPSGERGRKEGV